MKEKTHLPIIVDPSHSTGDYRYVPSMAKAAVACGSDGLMIEVHPKPKIALCDGKQSLNPGDFQKLMDEISVYANLVGKKIK